MPDHPQQSADPEESLRLLSEIAVLAHGFGVTSGRLEKYLGRVASKFGFETYSRVTPSSILIAISAPGQKRQFSQVLDVASPGFQLGRLARFAEIMDGLENDHTPIDDVMGRLRSLNALPENFGKTVIGLAYGLCGAGFAVLLSLAWRDVALSFFCAQVVFGLGLFAERLPALAARFEFLSAFVVAVIACLCSLAWPGIDPEMITLCGLIVLIPGFGLTVGTAELSSGLVVSGLERLSAAIVVTVKLFLGAYLGWLVVSAFVSLPEAVAPVAHDPVWVWVAVALLVMSLAVIFQVEGRDLPWIVLAGLITYAGITFGNSFGYWQGSFYGAIVLGLAANLYAASLRRPASIVLISVIMILVPGATALLGLKAGTASGIAALTAEWHALANILAILAGLLVAFSLSPPKSTL